MLSALEHLKFLYVNYFYTTPVEISNNERGSLYHLLYISHFRIINIKWYYFLLFSNLKAKEVVEH